MKKIDVHCHATNRIPFHVLPASARPEAIVQLMEQFAVERTVLLPTYFPQKGSGISNFRLYDWIRNYPQLTMFGSLDFGTYFRRDISELEELAERGIIKGLKIYSGYQALDPESSELRAVLDLARRYDFPAMLHCGYVYHRGQDVLVPQAHPSFLQALAQRYPDNTFIAAHLAFPYVAELIEVVRACPQVVADSSGLLNSKTDIATFLLCVEKIAQFLDACGPQRLLFGTDFPVQTHEHSIQMMDQALQGFSDGEKQQVYYGNAKRILSL